MREEVRTELKRKVFHCLSLVYLAAYHALGPREILWALGAWTAAEGAFERWRLADPALNTSLMRFFGGIHRDKEAGGMSGVWWTSLGSWLTMALFDGDARAVDAALLYLTFGDMAAGIVGKTWGRRRFAFLGRKKTLEGSLACLAVCLAAGAGVGLRGLSLWAGALTATVLELLPLPFNDNLWLPLGSALVLHWLR